MTSAAERPRAGMKVQFRLWRVANDPKRCGGTGHPSAGRAGQKCVLLLKNAADNAAAAASFLAYLESSRPGSALCARAARCSRAARGHTRLRRGAASAAARRRRAARRPWPRARSARRRARGRAAASAVPPPARRGPCTHAPHKPFRTRRIRLYAPPYILFTDAYDPQPSTSSPARAKSNSERHTLARRDPLPACTAVGSIACAEHNVATLPPPMQTLHKDQLPSRHDERFHRHGPPPST
eukprot:6188058-Pleurochrysis_carterae.AAC.1